MSLKLRPIVYSLRAHILLAMCLTLLASACTHTQSGDSPAALEEAKASRAKAAASNRIDHPFLWSMQQNGKTSYLFGTIHAGVDAQKELPKEVWEAFNQASCFVMEADLQAVNMQEMQAMTLQPQGKKLSDQISKEAWVKLKQKLQGQVSEAVLQRSQAWFVSLLLMREYTSGVAPMDEVFAEMARKQNKTMHVLEDWRDALKTYAEVTGAKELEKFIIEGSDEADMARLIAAYRSGDEQKVSAIINESSRGIGFGEVAMQRLLTARNQAWLPRLLSFSREGGCFVAVGTGHLIGSGSLRQLLQEKSFVLKRLD